jgi:hypothetical protein
MFLIHLFAYIRSQLRRDNAQLPLAALVEISKQLHATSLGQAVPAISIEPLDPKTVKSSFSSDTTPQWFISFFLLLGTVAAGILAKRQVFKYLH